jgi:predicted phage terminase large subunit-like protein
MRLEVRHTGFATQADFWRAPHRVRAFIGGLGSGKTRAGAVEILRQPAGSLGLVIAPTYRLLQDATQRTFFELTHKAEDGGAQLVEWHSTSRQETRLVNGSTILWRTATEPDRLRGVNAGWAWVDEAGIVDEDVWRIIMGRLRREPGRAWLTTTPTGAQHWTARLLGDPSAYVVRARTRDNTALPPEYIADLESRYDAQWRAQELEGQFVDWSGGLIRREWIRTIRPDALPTPLRWRRAWDLAASERASADETTSVRGALGPDGTLYLAAPIAGRWAWPEARQVIARTAEAEAEMVREVGVEQVASWRAAVDDLATAPIWLRVTLRRLTPHGDKLACASPWAARASSGRVVIVEGWDWSGWLDQWSAFPGGAHDDRVDAVSRVAEMVTTTATGWLGAFGGR